LAERTPALRHLARHPSAAAGCQAADDFRTQLAYVEDLAEEDAHQDFYKVDALLFNVFIMCQV
jgi:hypothetical protein